MVERTWRGWRSAVGRNAGEHQAGFVKAVSASLVQVSWRRREEQSLVELDHIFQTLVHLRNRAHTSGNSRDFALLQPLVNNVNRFQQFVALYVARKIDQRTLINHLDHIGDAIQREVMSYNATHDEPLADVAPVVKEVKREAKVEPVVEIVIAGKTIKKPLKEGHTTIKSKELGSGGPEFLVSLHEKGVFLLEPLSRIITLVVHGATKALHGDFLVNPGKWYECSSSKLSFKLRIVHGF